MTPLKFGYIGIVGEIALFLESRKALDYQFIEYRGKGNFVATSPKRDGLEAITWSESIGEGNEMVRLDEYDYDTGTNVLQIDLGICQKFREVWWRNVEA